MKQRETLQRHNQIANDTMHYIIEYLDTDIQAEELAKMLGVSVFHLHRVFHAQMGRSLYQTIQSLRLQKAASLLLTNPHSTITEIARMCGYSSQSSFLRAFKGRFGQTPKVWRQGGHLEYASQILNMGREERRTRQKDTVPRIVRLSARPVYYLRHQGYTPAIAQTWQKIHAWLHTYDIKTATHIGVYHDNPAVTPLEACHYVACVSVDPEEQPPAASSLSKTEIPGGIYAVFESAGEYGDILKLIEWVYHSWLPGSGYETTTAPSFSVFSKNHFLSKDGQFIGEYFVPVRYR